MNRIAPRKADRRTAGFAARVLIVALATAGGLATVAAQAQGADAGHATSPVAHPIPESGDLSSLERLFWDCDHAATTQSMVLVDAMSCSAITELFQRIAFGGDFGALLAWWREHKPAEHAQRDAALANRRAESANREVVPGPVSRL